MSKWYEHAVIYQIYPKSFQDSNGDGIGDLNGIVKRIDYLKKLGVNAVWLNPIYLSPGVDNGYDVSDYYQIDPEMGTMADFENLVNRLHKAGIHIIMDFVLNHTSDQHIWFKKAVSSPNNPYRDFYIFTGKNDQKPNNWGSFFGGSVWAKDPAGSGQSYFHLFDKRMPDLNWKNPKVREEMFKAAEFWLSKGIDGLRLDAFIHIAKAPLFQDYPSLDDKPVVAEPFFANRPEVLTWLGPFCKKIKKEYPDALLLGEAASANVNLAIDYTSKRNHLMDSVITFRYFKDDESQIDPNFSAQYQPKGLDWQSFKENQAVWQQTLDLPTLYWSNHDMARLATRIAKNPLQSRSLAMLMYLQRGIPVIYYGEELGLHNLEFDSVDQFEDQTVAEFIKSAENAGISENQAIHLVSQTHKLPARGVMPWNNEKGLGFSNHKPWLAGRRIDNLTVEDEEKDGGSSLNFYRSLLKLKQTPLFQKGSYNLLNTAKGLFVYKRRYKGKTALVAVSLSEKEQKISLSGKWKEILSCGEYSSNSEMLSLMPYSGIVLEKGE